MAIILDKSTGSESGTAIGSAVGTVIVPAVGTAVGGLIGGIIGAVSDFAKSIGFKASTQHWADTQASSIGKTFADKTVNAIMSQVSTSDALKCVPSLGQRIDGLMKAFWSNTGNLKYVVANQAYASRGDLYNLIWNAGTWIANNVDASSSDELKNMLYALLNQVNASATESGAGFQLTAEDFVATTGTGTGATTTGATTASLFQKSGLVMIVLVTGLALYFVLSGKGK